MRLGVRVLAPFLTHIEEECEAGLRGLEQQGFDVRRVRTNTTIDRARSCLASWALDDGVEVVLWADSDMSFTAEQAMTLLADDGDVVSGLYVRKALPLSAVGEPLVPLPRLGPRQGRRPMTAVGFGLVKTTSRALRAASETVPECVDHLGRRFRTMFAPLVDPRRPGHYMGEDYAFSWRAREAGVSLWCRTDVVLGHVGRHVFRYE